MADSSIPPNLGPGVNVSPNPDFNGRYVDISAGTFWKNNSGTDITTASTTLTQADVATNITTGVLLSSLAVPANQDGVTISLTIPEATIQSWLDGTLPPIIVLTSTAGSVRFDWSLPQFGNGYSGSRPLPQLVFDAAEAVPEPSTYALGLIGVAGLGFVVWRKRRV
jgi:hypothetical protein